MISSVIAGIVLWVFLLGCYRYFEREENIEIRRSLKILTSILCGAAILIMLFYSFYLGRMLYTLGIGVFFYVVIGYL